MCKCIWLGVCTYVSECIWFCLFVRMCMCMEVRGQHQYYSSGMCPVFSETRSLSHWLRVYQVLEANRPESSRVPPVFASAVWGYRFILPISSILGGFEGEFRPFCLWCKHFNGELFPSSCFEIFFSSHGSLIFDWTMTNNVNGVASFALWDFLKM